MQTSLDELYSVNVRPVLDEDSDGKREGVAETHRAQLSGLRLCCALVQQCDPDPDLPLWILQTESPFLHHSHDGAASLSSCHSISGMQSSSPCILGRREVKPSGVAPPRWVVLC